MAAKRILTEEHRVTGERLVSKIKELVHQGNIRRIVLKNEDRQTLIEIPLTIGVVSAVLLPVWVALGAIAALAAHYTLVVERIDERGATPTGDPGRIATADDVPVGVGAAEHDGDAQC
jgi:Domain of unknown function (DUF4342)